MADLNRLVQNEDEMPQQYLARFIEVMNIIYDADFVAVVGSLSRVATWLYVVRRFDQEYSL